MDAVVFEKFLNEVREQTKALAQDSPEEIARFIAEHPRQKFANIQLGPGKHRAPANEVVMPVGMRLGKAVGFLKMLDRPRRTFGRGQLNIR